MEWPLLELGSVYVFAADPRGMLVEYRSSYRHAMPPHGIRLVPHNGTAIAEDTGEVLPPRIYPLPPPPPFERTSLGNKSRLGWPNGAMAIGELATLTGWGDRYAIVLDDRGFSVIDAESDRVVRLMFPPGAVNWSFAPIASAGHVWAAVENGVLAIPTAALETLTSGTVDVTFIQQHPRRKPEARLDCVFLWFLQNGKAMVEIGDGKKGVNEPKLEIAMPDLGLAKYTPIQLVDELYPQHYAALEVAGHGRVPLRDVFRNQTHTAKVTSSRAKDPAKAQVAPPSALPPRQSSGELDRLVAAIAANPADDAQRAVLADLLIELGDPSADAIAKVRADGKASPAKLQEALGPLGPYLTKVELVGGFPVEATVSHNAPDERDHAAELDAACADFRLGMLHTLHSQPGRRARPEIYARLVAAPIATGLRRVDVSDAKTIDALIAAGRDQLEAIEYVDFAKAAAMERLAIKTFYSVTIVHTVVGLAHLQPLVNRLIKDKSSFFKRAKRRLVLEETMDRNAELFRALGPVWPKLPITALTIAGVTVERDGSVTGENSDLVAIARQAFAGQ